MLHSHLALGLPSGYFPLHMLFQSICPSPRLSSTFFNVLCLYGDGLSAPRPTPKQGNHPLSAVGDYFIHSQELSISGGRLLHPQPHDASCRGEKHPLIADFLHSYCSEINRKQMNYCIYTLRTVRVI